MKHDELSPNDWGEGGDAGDVASLFDPGLFRRYAGLVVDKLERYLRDTSIRGLALTDPSALMRETRALTASPGASAMSHDDRLAAILDLYIRTGIQVYSPGYMGRQYSGAMPLAGIVDLVNGIVNQPASFYEAAQLPNVAERIMAEELNRFIGWPADQFTMVTTSGGSLANLTALLAARNDKIPAAWSQGLTAAADGARPAVAVSIDAHYSIGRAIGVLGIGDAQIVRLPINRARQICVDQVRPTLAAAERRGLRVFCLVASAATTSIGAFDDLDQLADVAAERDLWLHVDGAHGASLLIADALRHKLRGIERADSLTWDAHKMLFVPASCTLLFYRNKDKARAAFRQEASYVFENHSDSYTEYDSAEKNLECTKRAMIMNLWIPWALYGRKPFAAKIEQLCRLTRTAYEIVAAEPDFDALHEPESNILCFRYAPRTVDSWDVGELQHEIRRGVRARGFFFISKVDIDGAPALRTVFMNHDTNADHVRLLLREIRTVAHEILRGRSSEPAVGSQVAV